MRASQACVLALAARHGRIAFVFLKNGQPKDWALSCKGSKSWHNAATLTGEWIMRFDPDVVVIEDPGTAKRKKANTKALLRAMIRVAERSPAMVAKPQRVQHFNNKYEEAQGWVDVFPQLSSKLPPKRRLWDPEPRNLVFFEALTLAQEAGFLTCPKSWTRPEQNSSN